MTVTTRRDSPESLPLPQGMLLALSLMLVPPVHMCQALLLAHSVNLSRETLLCPRLLMHLKHDMSRQRSACLHLFWYVPEWLLHSLIRNAHEDFKQHLFALGNEMAIDRPPLPVRYGLMFVLCRLSYL